MTEQTTITDKKKTNDAVHVDAAPADASNKLVEHAHALMKEGTKGADKPADVALIAASKPALAASAEATPTAQAAKPPEAPAGSGKSWLDFTHDVYDTISKSTVATMVESGWDKLSTFSEKAYDSIISDKANTTTKIDAKLGADGKPDYFLTDTANGKHELGADYSKYIDPKGGSIEKNSKTGEIRSQSADGHRVFTRTADGTEIFRNENIEYSRTKDGKYQVRDNKGDVTNVNSQGAITDIDKQFRVAQRITNIDETTAKPEPGQLEAMPDGQHYMDRKNGNVIVARKDGHREVFIKNGPHLRTDAAHQKLEIEENGNWRELKKEEFAKLHHCDEHVDAQGHKRFQLNGVDLEANGAVKTADKVTLGEPGPAGKMVAHVPTADGTGAVVTNNPDHTSDLLVHGHDTRVNPDDPAHLVQGFKANPDGSLGPSDFNYNSQNNSFNTDGVNWDQYGDASLAWNGCNIDSDGTATYDNGRSVFADYSDAQELQTSAQYTQQSCMEASSAISTAVGKLSSNSVDAGDLGSLMAASGDLDAALANAMASENFGAVVALSQAKGSVSTAIDAVAAELAKKTAVHEKAEGVAKADNLNFLPELTFENAFS